MNSNNLENLEALDKLYKEEFAEDYVPKKYDRVSKRIKSAEYLLKNNDNDEEYFISAYSELYSSFRNLCEIMLALHGYRVGRKVEGHHQFVISTIWITLNKDEMSPVYLRLAKIAKKRTSMEYGPDFDISTSEMIAMLNDVKLVFEKVGDKINEQKQK